MGINNMIAVVQCRPGTVGLPVGYRAIVQLVSEHDKIYGATAAIDSALKMGHMFEIVQLRYEGAWWMAFPRPLPGLITTMSEMVAAFRRARPTLGLWPGVECQRPLKDMTDNELRRLVQQSRDVQVAINAILKQSERQGLALARSALVCSDWARELAEQQQEGSTQGSHVEEIEVINID